MNDTTLIQDFSDQVNQGLAQGEDWSPRVLKELASHVESEDQRILLDTIHQTFLSALNPTTAIDLPIQQPDEHFEQCYELLKLTFDPSELDSREEYIHSFTATVDQNNPSRSVLLGRFLRTVGVQQYNPTGQLLHFTYDPLSTTETIVGALAGNYMPLQSPHAPQTQSSIGAIGNVAVREHLRGRGGHGTALASTFEQHILATATTRGETVQLFILEAEERSVGFWLKMGYRWAQGTHYAQPPIAFDPVNGTRFYDEVPEILMVKLPAHPTATAIDAQLLSDAVYTMYQNWCLAGTKTYSPQAQKKAEAYVLGKVFGTFQASLPKESKDVPLTTAVDGNALIF